MNSKQTIRSFFFAIAAKVGSLFKVSFMLGSYTAFFSLSNAIMPVSGAYTGMLGATLATSIGMLLRMMMGGSLFALSYTAQWLPGLFAAYYFASRSFALRAGVPLLCMLFFALKSSVWVYSLFWLIPIAVYLSKTNNLFVTALGSTFTAHAVGSVIWLYTMPTTNALWYSLMPIVPIERVLFALGMVATYRVAGYCFSAMRSYRSILRTA